MRGFLHRVGAVLLKIGAKIAEFWLLLVVVVLHASFAISALIVSVTLGWWTMKWTDGGPVVFAIVALLLGIFLSAYVWVPYVRPAVARAGEVLTDAAGRLP